MSALLAVDDVGSGEPLVLIHGLATTRLIWTPVVPALSRNRRVVTLDAAARGHPLALRIELRRWELADEPRVHSRDDLRVGRRSGDRAPRPAEADRRQEVLPTMTSAEGHSVAFSAR